MKCLASACLLFLACAASTLDAGQSRTRRDTLFDAMRTIGAAGDHDTKCGLPLVLDVRRHWTEFPLRQQEELSQAMAPPSRQKSRISGVFQIFYDTTGPHEPALLDLLGDRIPNSAEAYIDSVGLSFMAAWNYEVNVLGYDPVGSSRVDLQACKLEYSIVSPK